MGKQEILSRWHTLIEDFHIPPETFYSYVEAALKQRDLPNVWTERVMLREGSYFSTSREYLRVVREEYTFDICAAPFGSGFFVSWWLHTKPEGCFVALLEPPIPQPALMIWQVAMLPFTLVFIVYMKLFKQMTFYRQDTAHMFQETVHQAVLQVIDGVTKQGGIRALADSARKPVMKEFFDR